jgi:hypothetical protein
VIVRISGEGQYEIDDAHTAELNRIDNEVVAAVDGGDEAAFADRWAALLDYVRANGTETADDDLSGSDLILPPADISFDEASEEFTGEGLIPD